MKREGRDGEIITASIAIEIDVIRIVNRLAGPAINSKAHKSAFMDGAVIVRASNITRTKGGAAEQI